VPAKRSNSVLCRSDPKAGKRGECLLIRQQRTILLVFGIYGSRRREEEDTVTFVSGLVKEKKTLAQIGLTGNKRKKESENWERAFLRF